MGVRSCPQTDRLEVHAADTYAQALMEPVLAAAAGRL
jgi:hypothetical protein